MPSKNAFKNTALVLISIIAALIVTEVVVRIAYGDKFGRRPAFYVGDPKLGWSPAPHLDNTFYGSDFSIHVSTDSEGYRLGALGEADYSAPLIALCGDSYAFGWGVSTDETFASYLDEMMYTASGRRIRLVNLGVGGYGTMQEAVRLSRFLQAHGEVNLKAILVEHTVNDALDNVNSLGYVVGTWEVESRKKSRSRLHLLNVVSYFMETLRSRQSNPEVPDSMLSKHPYLQDMLWGYERVGKKIGMPPRVNFGHGVLNLKEKMKPEDWSMSYEDLLQRRKLTDLQRSLMLESLYAFQAISAHFDSLYVFHMFIYTTPKWYVDEVSRLIRQSTEESGGKAAILGRIPPDGSYTGAVYNKHSGLHFTPDFNKYWAGVVFDSLKNYSIIQ